MSNDKMIYNDDNTIGVDEQSLNKLMNILTPRMQKQLVDSLHNNSEVKQWAVTLPTASMKMLVHHLLRYVTTTCFISSTIAIM